MKLTLNKLLKTKPFTDGEIITSTIYTNTNIDSVTVMDTSDINNWIKPNEILIAGNFFKETIDSSFIKKIVGLKCPAIITKKKFIQYISTETLETANLLNFPIIAMPDYYSWSELSLPICKLLIDSSNKINLAYENFNKIITDKILKKTEFNNICDDLSDILNIGIALINKSNHLIDYSKNVNWRDLLKNNNIDATNFNGDSSIQIEENTLKIYDLNNNYINYLILFIDNNTSELSFLRIETLIQVLKLKITMYINFFEEKNIETQILLKQFLNYRSLDVSSKISLEMSLKHIIQPKYYIAIFEINSAAYFAKTKLNHEYSLSKILNQKLNFQNEILIFENKNIITVFISNENSKEYIDELFNYISDYFNTKDIYCGISSYNDINHAQNSYNQAKSALNYVKTNKTSRYKYYTSIGFLRLLTDAKGNYKNIYFNELLNYYINPIIEYDKKYNSELLKTINIFIQTCYSYKKTSELLFIHVNTLRARLDKLEEILNIDRHNPDDMLNLQIGLKIYFESENIKP